FLLAVVVIRRDVDLDRLVAVGPEVLERDIERRVEAAADLAGPADGEDQLLLLVLDARLVGLEAFHVAQAVGVEILEQRRERLLDLAPRDAFEDGNVGVDVDFMPHGEHLGREWPILPLKSRGATRLRRRQPGESRGFRRGSLRRKAASSGPRCALRRGTLRGAKY